MIYASGSVLPQVFDVICTTPLKWKRMMKQQTGHDRTLGNDQFAEETLQDDLMTVNMGPQHPGTHGVLRLILTVNGETVVTAVPDIGFVHTGIEKTAEGKSYH